MKRVQRPGQGWILACGVVFLLVVAGTAAAKVRSKPVALRTVTPEQLAGPGPDELMGRAAKAYASERYEQAARFYVRVLEMRPGQPAALYDLACCYGRLGSKKQASEFLRAAWEAGYRDLDHILADKDFDPVRSSRPFKRTMAALTKAAAESKARKGKIILVPVPTRERVLVLQPEGYSPRKKVPLVVGLHGAGADEASFADFFADSFRKRGILFCAPRGQYARAVGLNGRLGYLWFERSTGGTNGKARGKRLAEEWILAAIGAVTKAYAVDEGRIYLVGFSQGGEMAYSLALDQPSLFRGVVPVGGRLKAAGGREAFQAGSKFPRFLVCHSPEDRVVPWAESEAATAFLKKKEIPFERLSFAGGHVVSPSLVDKITEWIVEDARKNDPEP